jgi:hypothetical protein
MKNKCPHPAEKQTVVTIGGQHFSGGDQWDDEIQILVCTKCGKVIKK